MVRFISEWTFDASSEAFEMAGAVLLKSVSVNLAPHLAQWSAPDAALATSSAIPMQGIRLPMIERFTGLLCSGFPSYPQAPQRVLLNRVIMAFLGIAYLGICFNGSFWIT